MSPNAENTDPSALVEDWRLASKLLNFDIEAPFTLHMPTGASIAAKVLVRGFGAPNGMLIVNRFEDIRTWIGEIQVLGFGFAVMDEPRAYESFDLQTYVDVLRDWGWSGSPPAEPHWLDPGPRA